MRHQVQGNGNSGQYEKRWWALGALALSLMVISLDHTILNVAIPSLRDDLSATASELQWVMDAYVLVFAGLLLAAGSLGDRFGRKRALQFGLLVFAAGSVASALSTSSEMLIASRALMGIGGAFIMPATLSIITNIFPAEERGKAIAAWAAVSGLGIVLGPIAGGVLLESFDWSAVFWVNIPLIAIAIIAGRSLIPESRDPEPWPLDIPGVALSIGGLVSLTWAIIEAPAKGWTDPMVLGVFAGGAALAAAFVAWELRTPTPMLEMRLFRNPRFSAASASLTIAFAAMMGVVFLFTQYLQSVLGYSALEAGVAMLPTGVALIVAAPISAKLDARFGTKVVVAGGLLTVAAGLGIGAALDASSSYVQVAASLAAFGAGMGLCMAPTTDAVMGAVPLDMAGVGSAMNDATRMVGGALGIAILGSVASSGYGAGVESSVQGLPAGAAEAAGDSVGAAAAVASQVGGPAGDALRGAAEAAYVSGMNDAYLVGVGMLLVGAVAAIRYLPARGSAQAPTFEELQAPAAAPAVVAEAAA
jgi:EmrB/QacA subfamily drug resistance transporter